MPRVPRPGHAPVVFDDLAFGSDVERSSAAAAEVARIARRRYERDGVPQASLRRCENEGRDGTALRRCLKVYLPPPGGRFGMVFQLVVHSSGARLRYIAFGVRHHPQGSNALTVYQIAHRRLHG